jgi:hypothetical protein
MLLSVPPRRTMPMLVHHDSGASTIVRSEWSPSTVPSVTSAVPVVGYPESSEVAALAAGPEYRPRHSNVMLT